MMRVVKTYASFPSFEAASSIAYWMGDLFIGTPGGNVLRAKKEQG